MKKSIVILFLMTGLANGCMNSASAETTSKDSLSLKQNISQEIEDVSDNKEIDLGDIISQEEGYTLYCNMENEGWYAYKVYNMQGNVIGEEMQIYRCPYITMLSNDIVQVSNSAGPNTNFDWFFDRKSGERSQTFTNVIAQNQRLIAYIEFSDSSDADLIVQDIFDKNIYYQIVEISYELDLRMMPAGKFLNDNKLEVTYYIDGGDEVTENIILHTELG